MAVIVANVYQQAAMCASDKHRAPQWLIKFALIYMSPLLHLQEKVKAILSQKVRQCIFIFAYIFTKSSSIRLDVLILCVSVFVTRSKINGA
jgi:hypothetical protein